MSIIPNIVNRAYNVNVAMSRRLATARGTSLIVPVAPQTLDASEFGFPSTILMDHPRLTPMREFDLGYGLVPFMGHDLGYAGEFVYECAGQDNSGAFHLIGAPGLFSVGAVRWVTNNGGMCDTDIAFSVQVYHVDQDIERTWSTASGTVKTLKGVDQATFYLRTGDFFKLVLEPALNPHRWGDNTYTIFGYSDVALTRLSSNAEYERVLID